MERGMQIQQEVRKRSLVIWGRARRKQRKKILKKISDCVLSHVDFISWRFQSSFWKRIKNISEDLRLSLISEISSDRIKSWYTSKIEEHLKSCISFRWNMNSHIKPSVYFFRSNKEDSDEFPPMTDDNPLTGTAPSTGKPHSFKINRKERRSANRVSLPTRSGRCWILAFLVW